MVVVRKENLNPSAAGRKRLCLLALWSAAVLISLVLCSEAERRQADLVDIFFIVPRHQDNLQHDHALKGEQPDTGPEAFLLKKLKEDVATVETEKAMPDHLLQTTDFFVQEPDCPREDDYFFYLGARKEIDTRMKGEENGVDSEWWRRLLNDKWAFFVFARSHGLTVPDIHFCSAGTPESLNEWTPSPVEAQKGFVVKIKEGFRASGVYALPQGFGGVNLLNDRNMSKSDVIEDMENSLPSKWLDEGFHVEELIRGQRDGVVPSDYKFLMFNGEVGAIMVVHNRGKPNLCIAYVDREYNRVDDYGCFSRRNYKRTGTGGRCIDPQKKGKKLVSKYKKCSKMQKPEAWDKLTEEAKRVSRLIGVFARVDLFVDKTGVIKVGEVTLLPFAIAKLYCVASLDEATGCVDTCHQGRLWKTHNERHNTTEGGPAPAQPDVLKGWGKLTLAQRCEAVMKARHENQAQL